MAGLLLPAMAKSVTRDVDHRARGRIVRSVLAIEHYRLGHGGKLPDGLNSFTPGLLAVSTRDPFDGQSLRYKTRPNGYIVYSIGPDATDDGGAEKSPARKRTAEPEDITFVVELNSDRRP